MRIADDTYSISLRLDHLSRPSSSVPKVRTKFYARANMGVIQKTTASALKLISCPPGQLHYMAAILILRCKLLSVRLQWIFDYTKDIKT